MFCTHCGREVVAHASFCPNCGGAQPSNVGNRRMVRPIVGRKVGGVCLAIANYLSTDVTLIRVIAVLMLLIPPFPAGLVYVIFWIVVPSEEYAAPAPPAYAAAPPPAGGTPPPPPAPAPPSTPGAYPQS